MIEVPDFVLRATLAGALVAAVAGPLGCFVVWRRMAFFGDAIAHSALFGVAIGLALAIDLFAGVAAVTVAVALALAVLSDRWPWLSSDALLGILSHTALAAGVVALALTPAIRVDLFSYLFGDILAVTPRDLTLLGLGALASLAAIAGLWRPLLAITVHAELARAEGAPAAALNLAFMLLIALVVALAMKIVGAMLITALLIVPASAARGLARSPESMATLAAAIGVAAVLLGLGGSLAADAPSGPAIVLAAALLFALTHAARAMLGSR